MFCIFKPIHSRQPKLPGSMCSGWCSVRHASWLDFTSPEYSLWSTESKMISCALLLRETSILKSRDAWETWGSVAFSLTPSVFARFWPNLLAWTFSVLAPVFASKANLLNFLQKHLTSDLAPSSPLTLEGCVFVHLNPAHHTEWWPKRTSHSKAQRKPTITITVAL